MSDAKFSLTGLGKVVAKADSAAVSRLATATSAVAEASTLPGKLTGRLVELDPKTVELLRTARQSVESGGWIQGTLRHEGKYARVARFRPAKPADIAGGLAGAVTAVAAQAQLAAIQRDVQTAIRAIERLESFEHEGLLSAIQSHAEAVERAWRVLVEAGPSERSLTKAEAHRDALRADRERCLRLAASAAAPLFEAAKASTPLGAKNKLGHAGMDPQASRWLEAAGHAHAAAVAADALYVAQLHLLGDPAADSEKKELLAEFGRVGERLEALSTKVSCATTAISGTFQPWAEHVKRRATRSLNIGGPGAAVGVAASIIGPTAIAPAVAAPAAAILGIEARRQVGAQNKLQTVANAWNASVADLGLVTEQLKTLTSLEVLTTPRPKLLA